jgi:hypothetical protein
MFRILRYFGGDFNRTNKRPQSEGGVLGAVRVSDSVTCFLIAHISTVFET